MLLDVTTPSRERVVSSDIKTIQHAPKCSYHILIIEDNKCDVVLTKRMLKNATGHHDYQFSTAARMSEVFDLLHGGDIYDLILLDLGLVDIDGTATVAALHAEAPHIPIIVHSGNNDPELKSEALMCGAKHFLVKGQESPFSLRFMIQETLQKTGK